MFGNASVTIDRTERSKRLRASAIAASGGVSRKGRRAGSGSPHSIEVSRRLDRSASRISGGSCAGSEAVVASSHSRIATPGAWRAARPARWVTAARLARSVTSRVSRAAVVARAARQAAIDDDRRRRRASRSSRRCGLQGRACVFPSAAGRAPSAERKALYRPWSLCSSTPAGSDPSASAVRSIRRHPGGRREANPTCSPSALRMAEAICGRLRPPNPGHVDHRAEALPFAAR